MMLLSVKKNRPPYIFVLESKSGSASNYIVSSKVTVILLNLWKGYSALWHC